MKSTQKPFRFLYTIGKCEIILGTFRVAHPNNRYLFQTRRNGKFTSRRVQQIVKGYAEEAGVNATPHTFRHQAITWLTRHSGTG